MHQKPSQDAGQITFDQAVFGLPEKSGQAQGAKGQGIVQQHLDGVDHIGARNELQDAVGKRRDQPDHGAVPVAYETDHQHGKQRDGAAVGQAGQFDDHGDDGGQGQRHGAEDDLSCGQVLGVFRHKKSSLCWHRREYRSFADAVKGQALMASKIRRVSAKICLPTSVLTESGGEGIEPCASAQRFNLSNMLPWRLIVAYRTACRRPFVLFYYRMRRQVCQPVFQEASKTGY